MTQRIQAVEHAGLVLPVHDSGPVDGESVVLLHGWPQDPRSWDRVAPLLHARGYRTYAAALRGSAHGAAPRSRWAYRKAALAADVRSLLDRIGRPVHLVGHDWGAAVAWSVATHHPTALATLTAVSVPHVGAVTRALPVSRQLLASWYMLAFQVPVLPELALGRAARAERLLVDAGQEPALAARDAALLGDPVVRRGGLNLYRSLAGDLDQLRGTTTVPTLQVWGDADVAVTRRAVDGAARHARGPYRLAVLPGVGHWVPEQAPADLAALVHDHAAQHPPRETTP